MIVWTGDSLRLAFSRSRKVECDCCGWKGNRFFLQTYITGAKVHSSREICPKCLSLERQRQLVRHLKSSTHLFSLNSPTILDIGPSRAVVKWFQMQGYNVISVDLMPSIATIRMDITRCGFKDNTFDLIVCSHVLEHIRDDLAAMREILRILKELGICIIQVPMQPNLLTTIEYDRQKPEEFDHVRAYGQDFASRLESVGFRIMYAKDELFEVIKPRPNQRLS
jgi:SAM-dependent methyltransferase